MHLFEKEHRSSSIFTYSFHELKKYFLLVTENLHLNYSNSSLWCGSLAEMFYFFQQA